MLKYGIFFPKPNILMPLESFATKIRIIMENTKDCSPPKNKPFLKSWLTALYFIVAKGFLIKLIEKSSIFFR